MPKHKPTKPARSSALACFNAADNQANEEKAVVNPEEVSELLVYVVRGQQDKAEAMLNKHAELARHKGSVTDYSARTFHHITAFQYAVWALDWHMWEMIKKYLSVEEAGKQWREWDEQRVPQHGKHFDFKPLLSAYQAYQDYCNHWDWDKLKQHWAVIREAQRLLPTHVVQQYITDSRAFYPVPDFTQLHRVKQDPFTTGYQWWYHPTDDTVAIRADYRGCVYIGAARPFNNALCSYLRVTIKADRDAIDQLSKSRIAQRDQLCQALLGSTATPKITHITRLQGFFRGALLRKRYPLAVMKQERMAVYKAHQEAAFQALLQDKQFDDMKALDGAIEKNNLFETQRILKIALPDASLWEGDSLPDSIEQKVTGEGDTRPCSNS